MIEKVLLVYYICYDQTWELLFDAEINVDDGFGFLYTVGTSEHSFDSFSVAIKSAWFYKNKIDARLGDKRKLFVIKNPRDSRFFNDDISMSIETDNDMVEAILRFS
jgi:hypothetical protein